MTKQRRMAAIARKVKSCRLCAGLNEPDVTESAPGFGSPDSPVAIVGQSLCRLCMASQTPFTGGSGRYINNAITLAGLDKPDLFITNVVHCHPPGDRKSQAHEIANCRGFLHAELAIVGPRLVIGLGDDAEAELNRLYAGGKQLPWPFVKPRTVKPDQTYLLFPEHPGSLRFKKTPERAYYTPSLAEAIRWGFNACN